MALLAGCHQQVIPPAPPRAISAAYKPYGAQQPPPRQGQPVALGYSGDLEAILAVGEPIGTVVVQADGDTPDEAIDAEAKRQAAEHGGTHVVRSAEPTTETDEVEKEDPTVYKHGERRSVGYRVLIVPPNRWPELPPALRPEAKP